MKRRHAVYHPDDVTGDGSSDNPIEPTDGARVVIYHEHRGECDGCQKPASLRNAKTRAEYEDAIRNLIAQGKATVE